MDLKCILIEIPLEAIALNLPLFSAYYIMPASFSLERKLRRGVDFLTARKR